MSRFRTPLLLATLAAAGLAAATPTLAQDARRCARWTASGIGIFDINQGNGLPVRARLVDDRGRLRGNATTTIGGQVRWNWWGPSRDFSGTARGRIVGTLVSDSVEFVIDWGDKRGYYSGTIDKAGTIYGTTYQIGAAGSKTTWASATPLLCAQRELSGPPAPVAPSGGANLTPSTGGGGGGAAARFLFGG